MPKTLTVAEQAIVANASQDLYRYERTCEEHSAILRRDLEGFTKAHQEYTANSNPMGFMPPRDEFDSYIEESEKVLKKDCTTVLDHLHVVHVAYFLCQVLTRKVSEHGEHVYLELVRRKVELEKKYPYVFPESPAAIHVSSELAPFDHPNILAAHTFKSNEVMNLSRVSLQETELIQYQHHPEPAPFDYPNILTAHTFKSNEVMNLPRVSLQETELIQYQHHPELLQRETFVSFNEDEAEYEVFRIPAFITADQERVFYVVYADEGPEAIACTSVDLFDLLRTSERVLK